jgi:hypothetical protein
VDLRGAVLIEARARRGTDARKHVQLAPRQAQLLSMASMVLVMTGVVVALSTWLNFGLGPDFVLRFARGWAIAFALAFPLAAVLMPRLQRFFGRYVVPDHRASTNPERR